MSASSAVAALFVHQRDRDMPGIALPRPEVQVVLRFGASAQRSIDVYAVGPQRSVHRKLLRAGMCAIAARLHLGAHVAVLGVPASAVADRYLPLEELWGGAAVERLLARVADAKNSADAGTILTQAIDERSCAGEKHCADLARDAASRLSSANVNEVAADLGVSERHLRRVFHETMGVAPKTYARLARFRRAVRAAREDVHVQWAGIAAATGYYDQAHLIAEFREIAGVTPQALLGELRASPW